MAETGAIWVGMLVEPPLARQAAQKTGDHQILNAQSLHLKPPTISDPTWWTSWFRAFAAEAFNSEAIFA